jgi:acyl-CoA thioester hydrolase
LEHVADVRVIFADTDAMGIVYYATYLKWFEAGRIELVRRGGMTYRDLMERGIHLPVVEASIRYLCPARFDDRIRINAEVRKLGGASVTFGYRLERHDGKVLAEGDTLHAFTDGTGKVVRAPADFHEKMNPENTTAEKGG